MRALAPRLAPLGVALGGPALFGAALGLPDGPARMGTLAVAVPVVLAAVVLATLPALYVTVSLLGGLPPAALALEGAGRSVRALGVTLAGLSPPAAFLLATVADPAVRTYGALTVKAQVGLVACAALVMATLAALRILFRALFVEGEGELQAWSRSTLPRRAAFVAWAALVVVLGARWLLATVRA